MRHTNNRYRRQQGATAVFVALALVPLLIATMLAIEVGRVYYAHRSLQKAANLAALDAARLMSGCTGNSLPTKKMLDDAAATSLTRNSMTGITSTVVEAGNIVTDRSFGGTGVVRYLDPVAITDSAAMNDAHGVRVTLTQAFPTPLIPFFSAGNRIMTASATAEQAALGSFYLGSGLLSVDAGILNALLSGLLGGNVTLDAVSYKQLASVGVSLADLGTAVGLDVHDLSNPLALSTKTPLLSDTLNGLAGALAGSTSTTVTNLLRNLGAAANGNRNEIPLGNLLGTVDDVAANVPFANLLDVILALAEASREDESGSIAPIALPVAVGIPGVTTLKTFIKVIEPPQFSGLRRAGVAEAKTSQVKLMVRLQVDALDNITQALKLVLLGGLLGQVTAPPINIGIDVDVARASAYLDSLQCPSIEHPSPVAELSAEPSVATLTLGTFAGSASTAPPISQNLAKLLGVGIKILGGLVANINVNLFLSGPVSTNVGNGVATPLSNPVTQFTRLDNGVSASDKPYWLADGVPPDDAVPNENPQTVGSTNLLSGAMSTLFASFGGNLNASDPNHPNNSTKICLLILVCIPVGDIVDAVLTPVKSLLGTVLSGVGGIVDVVLDPLLQALGIKLGSATVTMNTVSIDQPHIVSTAVPGVIDLP